MMHYIKLGLWIFVLSVLYAAGIFNIFGFYPELLFLFSSIYSKDAKTFRERVTVSVVCGVLMGALGGYGFLFSVLLLVYSSLVFGLVLREKLKNSMLLAVLLLFLVTFLYEGLFGVFVNGISHETMYMVLFASAVNTAFAIVLYPLVKLTFEEKERYIF